MLDPSLFLLPQYCFLLVAVLPVSRKIEATFDRYLHMTYRVGISLCQVLVCAFACLSWYCGSLLTFSVSVGVCCYCSVEL
jgi:hypothetical protein